MLISVSCSYIILPLQDTISRMSTSTSNSSGGRLSGFSRSNGPSPHQHMASMDYTSRERGVPGQSRLHPAHPSGDYHPYLRPITEEVQNTYPEPMVTGHTSNPHTWNNNPHNNPPKKFHQVSPLVFPNQVLSARYLNLKIFTAWHFPPLISLEIQVYSWYMCFKILKYTSIALHWTLWIFQTYVQLPGNICVALSIKHLKQIIQTFWRYLQLHKLSKLRPKADSLRKAVRRWTSIQR